MKYQKNTYKEEITRKEAIKKMRKYAALTALGTFVILNHLKAQITSPNSGYNGFWEEENNW